MHLSVFFRRLFCVVVILSITSVVYAEKLKGGLSAPYRAPKISRADEWINSAPLKMSELKGKVVLFEFWNYSCVACIQTLPYTKEWYGEYGDKGLVIIGVHSPEFSFQKEVDHVKNKVEEMGIEYPVVLDNTLALSKGFNNRHLPTYYLMNQNGYIVYQYHGVGNYIEIENNIRSLLGLKPILAPVIPKENLVSQSVSITQQIHFGYGNEDEFSSPESIKKDIVTGYSFPKKLLLNEWALQGNWKITADNVTSDEHEAALELHFKAKKMNIMMGSTTDAPIPVKIVLNNDVVKTITVSDHRFYTLVENNDVENGVLQIIPAEPGLEIYVITFG
jgi:thiol-disulfide isomerase/thioredoxin